MKFSVIIPVYNAAEYLERCLSSIGVAIKRASFDCDVICVDDGSNDNSWKILQDFSMPQLKLIHQENNSGVSAARNMALEIADGDWLLFVDSDDYVEENYFVEIEAAIQNNPDAQIVCFGSNSPFGKYQYASFWAKAYRRDVLPKGGFDAYSHGEDRLFLLKAMLGAESIVSIPNVLYKYCPHTKGLTSVTRSKRWILDTIGISRQMLEIAIKSGKVLPARFFRDIALWILEECVVAKDKLVERDKNHIDNEWKNILKYISVTKQISYWHRMVAKTCYYLGGPAELALCKIPRWLKKGF